MFVLCFVYLVSIGGLCEETNLEKDETPVEKASELLH